MYGIKEHLETIEAERVALEDALICALVLKSAEEERQAREAIAWTGRFHQDEHGAVTHAMPALFPPRL